MPYDRFNLRELLKAAFSNPDLRVFCSDNFLEVYENFGEDQSKDERILDLLDFVEKHKGFEHLAGLVKTRNPEKYKEFESRLAAAETPAPETTFASRFNEVMRRLMETAFTIDDLKTLCSDLNTNYENISGDTLRAKVRGILDEFRRSRPLADLVDYCRRERPNVSWPEPPHGVNVANALSALTEMMDEDVALREAVNLFKNTFEGANSRIEIVNFHKRLHDQLHILQVKCYDPLMNELKRVQDFKGVHESILQYVDHFRKIVETTKNIVSQFTTEPYDGRWITKLSQAQLLMSIAAQPDSFDLAEIRKAAQDTNNILSFHPTKINIQLMGAVNQLNLQRLKDAMTNVAQQFSRFNLDQQKVEEFKTGIASLDSLNRRLIKLTDEHNLWQEADRILRRVDEQMEKDISELERSWADLQPQIVDICRESEEEWAVRLQMQSKKLDKALKADPKDPKAIRDLFDNYRQQAIQRFFNVDTLLLSLCAELGEMGKRLTPLLEKM
jgi:hypothetical protein